MGSGWALDWVSVLESALCKEMDLVLDSVLE